MTLHQPGDDANGRDDPTQQTGRVPQFLPGNPHVSLAALRERIEYQFVAESANRPNILRDLDAGTRHEIVRDIVDYVLATESVSVSRADRLLILDVAYRDLFGFGPLDAYLADDNVTELTVDGPDKIYVRHGAADMTPVEVNFDDAVHLEHIIQRVLATEGTLLSDVEPILELGTVAAGRPARLIVTGPPVSPALHVEIRLHRPKPSTLEGCIKSGLLDSDSAAALERVVSSGRGMMIVGDVGTGKTTLLEALLPMLPADTCVVERAHELRLPDSPGGMRRLVAVPQGPDQQAVSFAEQIDAALAVPPRCMALDEVRFDEAPAMWRALTLDSSTFAMRCVWAFRGAIDPRRLRTAFSMSVRRAQPGIDQAIIHKTLVERLPFVVMVGRQSQRLRLLEIGEWRPDSDQTDGLALHTLWADGASERG